MRTPAFILLALLVVGFWAVNYFRRNSGRDPASLEEAKSKAYDHLTTADPCFVIEYEHQDGRISHRVVSGVRHEEDYFSARCHLRWGRRRRFQYRGLRKVVDVATGEVIPLEAKGILV